MKLKAIYMHTKHLFFFERNDTPQLLRRLINHGLLSETKRDINHHQDGLSAITLLLTPSIDATAKQLEHAVKNRIAQ